MFLLKWSSKKSKADIILKGMPAYCAMTKLNVLCLSSREMNWVNLLNLYRTMCEPGGDLTPFIERRINPGDNPIVSVPPKFPMYRNTGAHSSSLPFS
ncbi:hypothetical protein TNCV_77631 [Trichonephila clavipes]|nr:hypothetical protein TNCV_77631 [Trichonephila clavipes]